MAIYETMCSTGYLLFLYTKLIGYNKDFEEISDWTVTLGKKIAVLSLAQVSEFCILIA